jgi:AcrR family transcriptional regulator
LPETSSRPSRSSSAFPTARRAPGRRAGLTDARVVGEALALLDEGAEQFTLAEIARRLGVQLPSLYSHVTGLQQLKQLVRIRVAQDLARELDAAAVGAQGPTGLASVLGAVRRYALAHPGRWLAVASVEVSADDPEFRAATATGRASLRGVLRSFDVADRDLLHWEMLLWSWTHGYVSFEVAHRSPEFTALRFRETIMEFAVMIAHGRVKLICLGYGRGRHQFRRGT